MRWEVSYWRWASALHTVDFRILSDCRSGFLFQAMSGRKPFYRARTHGMVILSITTDKMCMPHDHPGLPEKNPLWSFLRRCWSPNPDERPTASDIVDEVSISNSGSFLRLVMLTTLTLLRPQLAAAIDKRTTQGS